MTAKPNFHFKGQVAGHVNLKKYKARLNEATGEMEPYGAPVAELDFHNLITDTGMDLIWGAPTYAYGIAYIYNICCVGTGNTTPAFTDVQLAQYLAAAGAMNGGDGSATVTYVPGPPTYWKAVQTYRFGTGVAAGNLTEIGFYPTSGSPTALFSRALILDTNGNPTTLTVEADEILDVTYEFRCYIDTGDTTGVFTSDGVDYNYILRGADIDNPAQIFHRMANTSDGVQISINLYDNVIGTNVNTPTGNSYNQTYSNGGTWSTYATGSWYNDFTTVVPVGSANWANGVRSMYITSPFHKVQIQFTDPNTGKGIPKVTGEKMSITYRFSWSRYTG